MTAVISLLMMGLGFLNGMIITTILDKSETGKINARLEKVLDQKFKLEKEVEDLKEELEYERYEKDEVVARLRSIVRQYGNLPPPCERLERSGLYADSEDGEFDCPISPSEDLNSTD
jgi:hypothetical protein